MPATASSFSMLGLLMGSRFTASIRHKDKEKDSKASSVVDVQIKNEPHITKAEEASTQAVAPTSQRKEPETELLLPESSDGYESSTDEHLDSAAPQPTGHADHDWTEVAAQVRALSPSQASLCTTDDSSHHLTEDDIADGMSSTSSDSESFHQETMPLQHEVSTSLNKLPAGVTTLRKEIVDMESEFKRLLQDLDATEQLNQDLKEEDQRRLRILRKNDEELQSMRKERAEAEKQLKKTGGELEAARQLNRELSNQNSALEDNIRGLDEVVRGLEMEKLKLVEALADVKPQLDTALQRCRVLEDEKRGQEEVIEGWREKAGALESEKLRLGEQLDSEKQGHEGLIEGWRNTAGALEAEKVQLVEQLDNEKRRSENVVESWRDTAGALEAEKLRLAEQLDNEKRRHEDVMERAQNAAGALEAETLRVMEQLANEKQQQKVEIQKLEESVRVLDSDKKLALQQLEDTRGRNQEYVGIQARLTAAVQRNRELEEDNRRIGNEMESLRKTLQDNIAATKRTYEENGRQKEGVQGLLRTLEEDRDKIVKQMEDLHRNHQELKEKCKHLMDEHDEKEQQLRSLKATHLKATNRLRAVRTDLEAAVVRNDELQKQNHLQASELEDKGEEVRSLEGNLAEMTIKLEDRRQLETAERRIRMLEDQVRRQTSELKAAKNQTRSGLSNFAAPIKETQSNLIGLVDMLNTEIFQISAFMADSLGYRGTDSVAGHYVKGAMERASRTMGKSMVLVLRSKLAQTRNETDFDPLPIQIGLQACMVNCCVRIMSSWYPGHWEYADFLAVIYSRIQGSGA